MAIGMLWFDNSPGDDLPIKVKRAADYYRGKYGRMPTVCFVHPTMVSGAEPGEATQVNEIMSDGIRIKKNRSIMPNHFWMGVEEQT